MKLTEIELLKLENLQLKGQAANAQLLSLQAAIESMVKEIFSSHNVDPETHGIDMRTGEIVQKTIEDT